MKTLKILQNPTFLLTILLVLMSAFGINSCIRANKEKSEKEQIELRNERNMAAMNDSVRRTWNRAIQQYESLKRTYEIENQKQLELYDKKLAYEINKLGKNIIDYIKLSGRVNLGDTLLDNQVIKYADDKYGLKWNLDYDDGGFKQKIVGTSKFSVSQNLNDNNVDIKIGSDGTKIDTNETTIKLSMGHKEMEKEGKKYYEVFVTSPSKKFVIDSLSSVYFIEKLPCPECPPKVRRITLGPYAGVGISAGPYQVGVGAQYNLRWKDIWNGIKNIFKK